MKPHVFGSSGIGRPVNLGMIGKQASVCCEKVVSWQASKGCGGGRLWVVGKPVYKLQAQW